MATEPARPLPNIPQGEAARGIGLNREQQQDRGIAAAVDASKQKDEAASPTAGGGLMTEPALELERARQREKQMRETQEQFVGVPGAVEAGGEQPAEEAVEAETTEEEIETEEEAAPEEEAERAMLIAQQQAVAQARQVQAREQAIQDLRQRLQAGQAKPNPLLQWMLNSPLAMGIWWNVQLINAYLFKDRRIPKPSFEKQVATINMDAFACFSQLVVPPCGCLVAVALLYAILGLIEKYLPNAVIHVAQYLFGS